MQSADTLSIFGMPSPTSASSAHSGVSPHSSAEEFEFDFQGEEEEERDDFGVAFSHVLENKEHSPSISEDGANKKRSRRPPSTAAKRASHNAVERARRESLNGRFMELAHVLPNMSMIKRPSKNSIVEHAIDYVATSEKRDRALTDENASLLAELNTLRAQLGMPARPALEIIIETPAGKKPPSTRPSTIQPTTKQVAQHKPVVNITAQEPAVSPRTISAPPAGAQAPPFVPAPSVVPAAQAVPFDWMTTKYDAFNMGSFDPNSFAPGTQTGGGFYSTAWPAAHPYMPAVPMSSISGFA